MHRLSPPPRSRLWPEFRRSRSPDRQSALKSPRFVSAKLPFIKKVDAKNAVLVAQGHGRPLRIERHLHTNGLRIGIVQAADVGKRDIVRHALQKRLLRSGWFRGPVTVYGSWSG